jgi:hypothetical protein
MFPETETFIYANPMLYGVYFYFKKEDHRKERIENIYISLDPKRSK